MDVLAVILWGWIQTNTKQEHKQKGQLDENVETTEKTKGF